MDDEAATNGGSTTSDEKAPTNGGSATSTPTNGGSTTSDAVPDHRPSPNSLALVRKAIPRTYISSDNIEEWCRAVYEGVLLENNTQKFWVDEKLHKNCFLVLPKACDIAGGDEQSCWSWITKEERCFSMAVDIHVPESKELSWFLIQGRFKTRALSPNTTYEVAFAVKLNRTRSINLRRELVLPDGTKQHRGVYLVRELKEEWTNVPAGEFIMGPESVGTIHFGLQGWLDRKEDRLILRGVLIHPKD